VGGGDVDGWVEVPYHEHLVILRGWSAKEGQNNNNMKLTRYCGDISRAVFIPATTENHIVYFAMMAAEPPTKGIYVFRARGCFREEMEPKVRPGDNEPLDGLEYQNADSNWLTQ